MAHLVVAITAHGFGHAAQVAPVLNELGRRDPALRLTLVTELPEAFLRTRIEIPFECISHAADFGFCMHSAFAIDLPASLERYRILHRNWQAAIENESRFLAKLAPDCVLADVPYLSLAAARRLDVAGVALCSLNWADVFAHYLGDEPDAGDILAQMRAAYADADLFIRPTPAMPMEWLHNSVAVGVIARVGRRRRETLCSALGVAQNARIVLAAPGGIDTQLPLADWAGDSDIVWLVPDRWDASAPHQYRIGSVPMSFTDLLASVDCVLGKCGYGTVAECVANGTPLAYLPRPDWPEEAGLVDWLRRHDAGLAIDSETLAQGGLTEAIESCARQAFSRVAPHGASEAADCVQRYLGAGVARGETG